MRENRLRTLWRAGRGAVNGWLLMPDAFAAETMAHQGWDALTVDMQHGIIGYQAAVHMVTAISTTGVMPVVRVPWLDSGIVMKMLDAGAFGIICPMVNSRADAEQLVAAAKYPPRGSRSFGPIRAALYGGDDYVAHANDSTVVFAMIETRQALDNLDDILTVEGLDAVYIGPADLASSLGQPPGFDYRNGPVRAAIEHVLARARVHGVVAGIHNGTTDYARSMIELGFQFVTVGSDMGFMAAGARQAVAAMRVPGPGVAGD